jgi:hypothetical protein
MKSRYCDFIQPHWLNLARAIGDIPQTFISRSNVWQIFFIIYVSVPAEEKRHQLDGMEMTVMEKKPPAKQGHQGQMVLEKPRRGGGCDPPASDRPRMTRDLSRQIERQALGRRAQFECAFGRFGCVRQLVVELRRFGIYTVGRFPRQAHGLLFYASATKF